ncbi:MAG TPA: carboxypeptidase regulatory-like domain-containing protein [Bryobacteraceae bacterium]
MSRFQSLLLLGCVLAGASFAQEFRGTLSGRVLDPQQALIPGAKIVAVENETGAKFTTNTNADGSYVLPFLPPGPYTVTVEAAGFKRYANPNVRVTTNEREQLDITLEVGTIDQAVTVSAEAMMVETSTASTGQVINTRSIENLPINGRAPLALAQLAFGVTPNSDPKFSRPFDNSGPSGFSMGGAPNQSNELLIDGSPDVTKNSRVAYNPPPDAVQEIKVEAFQADAAYGHTGGGTVNVVMRGGTNQLHGSAYEFNQVSRLAATPWFTNKAGQKKSQSIFNQWGLTVGGPIWIPKLIHGKDKVFFFFGYEGIHDAFPEPQTETVATAAERAGDFSQLLSINSSSSYVIYDPLTGVAQSNGRVQRSPFAGNKIDPNRISPIAKNLLSYIPLPNQTGTVDGANNYIDDSIRRDVFDGELGRLDYNISDRHKFFYSFRHNYRVEDRNNHYHNIATGNLLNRINWGNTLDDVYTLSPTAVMNIRLNWTRFTEANDKPSAGLDVTKLGFPSYIAQNSQRLVMPIVDLNRYSDWGDNAGDRTPFDIFQIFGSLTKIHGKHTLKFGGDAREFRESSASYGNSAGQYIFREDYTRGPLDNSSASPIGQDLAALILGYPTGGGFDINSFRTNQSKYYAVFLQDDYRPRSNLTFNLGIRFEGDLGTTERFNRSVAGFDPAATLPITAAAQAAYAAKPVAGGVPASQFSVKGGLLFEGGGDNKYVYNTQTGYFSPRFGFAWTPGGRGTVIRGGFGIFVAPIITPCCQQPGYSQNTTVLGSGTTSNLRPAVTLDNPFPGGIQQPTGASLGVATFLGKSITFYNPNPLNPYSIRWNFDIQRQIGKGAVFEIGYTGNHYVHLTIDQNLNGTPAQYLSSSPVRDQAVIDRNSNPVPNPFVGLLPGTNLSGSTVSFTQLTLAYPQFTGVTMQASNSGESYFHALQTRFEKRFSHGFQMLANYQFSRTMTKDRYMNSFGPLEKRPADIDRPHRFVASGSYELPFGKGKPVLGSLSGFGGAVVDRIVGGWMINGIYSRESGGPAGDWGDLIYFGGPLNWDPNNVDHAFDVTQFNRVSAQQVGEHIRSFPTRFGNLRLPPTNNVDASVIKNTRLKERFALQYRCEFFNAFNHPVFNGPNLSATASAFGTIGSVYNLERHIQMALRLTW